MADEERERVSFLAPEDVPDYIADLAQPPEPSESMVKGYKVRVSRTTLSPNDAKARRETMSRILAKSLAKQDS